MDAQATTDTKFKPPVNAAVWFEIPVSDLERAKTFYSKVLQTGFTDQEGGVNAMAIFDCSGGEQGVSGHLYPGRPAANGAGPTIHLPVPDSVEEGLARVEAAGGKVLSPVFEIPAGRFAYCTDPDGNSIGIFAA